MEQNREKVNTYIYILHCRLGLPPKGGSCGNRNRTVMIIQIPAIAERKEKKVTTVDFDRQSPNTVELAVVWGLHIHKTPRRRLSPTTATCATTAKAWILKLRVPRFTAASKRSG